MKKLSIGLVLCLLLALLSGCPSDSSSSEPAGFFIPQLPISITKSIFSKELHRISIFIEAKWREVPQQSKNNVVNDASRILDWTDEDDAQFIYTALLIKADIAKRINELGGFSENEKWIGVLSEINKLQSDIHDKYPEFELNTTMKELK